MTNFDQFRESLLPSEPPAKKLPDMLQVLTILSFIGCAYYIANGVLAYFTICSKSFQDMAAMGSKGPMAGMMGSMNEVVRIQCAHRLSVLLVTIATNILCVIGLVRMRRLKRSGFWWYLLGELGSPAHLLILGAVNMFMVINLCLPVLFAILYATQLKHLKR